VIIIQEDAEPVQPFDSFSFVNSLANGPAACSQLRGRRQRAETEQQRKSPTRTGQEVPRIFHRGGRAHVSGAVPPGPTLASALMSMPFGTLAKAPTPIH